jgi:hypothetical protein
MDAGTQTLKRIFEHDKRYLVPMFQRPYVWGADAQWRPLWEDVRDVAERIADGGQEVRPHFLGAIVLDHIRQPFGKVEARLVIDGQQRLTTLQLLLEAAADLCRGRAWDNFHRAFAKLTRNEDPLSTEPDDVFKVWPTNVDREAFRRVMEAQSEEALRAQFVHAPKLAGSGIAQAYLFFSQAIRGWLPDDDVTSQVRIGHLHTTLREMIRLVVIDLGERDDPQLIFETMNARGTPLLPADLVKNYLFHRAQRANAVPERLHQLYWRHFDDEASYWRSEVAAGRVKRTRIDLFLQHYLAMETGQEVQVGHLYDAFRQYVDGSSCSAEQHLAALAAASRVFRSFDDFGLETRAGQFLKRLEDLEVTTAHPLLLYALGLDLGSSVSDAIAADLESFLVRRLVCHLTTKNYNRLFLEALKAVRAAPTDAPGALRRFLLEGKGESVRWPADSEFRAAWLEMPTYRVQARRRTRMLLEAAELASRGPKAEHHRLSSKLTIEHILPQNWHEHWPLKPDDDHVAAQLERERLLHTIGNLTLLTAALNPAISNGPWIKKRSELRKHSVLILNNRLGELEQWDEEAIRARALSLLDLALTLWPRPAQPDDAEAANVYSDMVNRIVRAHSEAKDQVVSPETFRCPIPECEYVFKRSKWGWDGHVSSLKMHPKWHPEAKSGAERREIFRQEFADFLPNEQDVGLVVGREHWEGRSAPGALAMVDDAGRMVEEMGITPRWSYTRKYIALGDAQRHFAWFKPDRTHNRCWARIRSAKEDRAGELARLTAAGVRWAENAKGPASLTISARDWERHRSLFQEMLASAAHGPGG